MPGSKSLEIPASGFKALDIHFPDEKISNLYHLFDEICICFEKSYEHYFSGIDQIISKFITETNTPLANQTLQLKNLKIDELKYKSRTSDEYNIFSYQYIPGVYEYIKQRIDRKSESLNFFKEIDTLHTLVKDRLQQVIVQIEKKVKIATALKIWKHKPTSFNSSFLPIHCDRSIFTVIVHADDQGEECLRIYPPQDATNHNEGVEQLHPVTPQKSDFPMIFPGMYAKPIFFLNPTPHSVVSNARIPYRHSLIFFIARQEGW